MDKCFDIQHKPRTARLIVSETQCVPKMCAILIVDRLNVTS